MSGNDELDAMKAVSDGLASLDEAAAERVLTWAWSKFVGTKANPAAAEESVVKPAKKSGTTKKKSQKAGAKKAATTAPTLLKDLNLMPKGKTSFADFVKTKKPSSNQERVAVAVHYVENELKANPVTISHVYTCFKAIGWRLPMDFVNTVQQAGSKGYINSSDREKLTMAAMGENLIDHDLPRQEKKSK